jgi:hypothetical protein
MDHQFQDTTNRAKLKTDLLKAYVQGKLKNQENRVH